MDTTEKYSFPAEITSYESAARLQLVLHRLTRNLRQRATTKLTHSQIATLVTIEEVGPIRLGALATLEAVGPPVVTRVVGILESLDFVTRIEDPGDKRAPLVELTSRGHALIAELRSDSTTNIAARLSGLRHEDQSTLIGALHALEKMTRPT